VRFQALQHFSHTAGSPHLVDEAVAAWGLLYAVTTLRRLPLLWPPRPSLLLLLLVVVVLVMWVLLLAGLLV
jgi:hypothetical protein